MLMLSSGVDPVRTDTGNGTSGRDTHLGSCVHVGAQLDELRHHFHMTLFGGQVKSIQTILKRRSRP